MADLIDLAVIVIPVIILVGGGIYTAIKKFVVDLVKAGEDDQYTREEIILLIEDGIGIINVFKHAFNKIFKRK